MPPYVSRMNKIYSGTNAIIQFAQEEEKQEAIWSRFDLVGK